LAQTAEQTPTLKEIMEQERNRLTERKKDIAAELEVLDAEIAAIDAYFSAISSPRYRQENIRKPRTPGGDRAPRGSVQTTVFDLINKNPEGLTRTEIIAKLPDIQEPSISNALSTLVKTGRIKSQGRGGKYHPITIEPSPADAEPPK
jgi:hypothetical protein